MQQSRQAIALIALAAVALLCPPALAAPEYADERLCAGAWAAPQRRLCGGGGGGWGGKTERDPGTTARTAVAMTTTHAMATNAMATNAMATNAMATNAMATNAMATNAMATNAMTSSSNAMTTTATATATATATCAGASASGIFPARSCDAACLQRKCSGDAACVGFSTRSYGGKARVGLLVRSLDAQAGLPTGAAADTCRVKAWAVACDQECPADGTCGDNGPAGGCAWGADCADCGPRAAEPAVLGGEFLSADLCWTESDASFRLCAESSAAQPERPETCRLAGASGVFDAGTCDGRCLVDLCRREPRCAGIKVLSGAGIAAARAAALLWFVAPREGAPLASHPCFVKRTFVACTDACAAAGDGVCDDGEGGACPWGSDCGDCGVRGVERVPASKGGAADGKFDVLCADECPLWNADGVCHDGGLCPLGTDCTDCGPRASFAGWQPTFPTSPSNAPVGPQPAADWVLGTNACDLANPDSLAPAGTASLSAALARCAARPACVAVAASAAGAVSLVENTTLPLPTGRAPAGAGCHLKVPVSFPVLAHVNTDPHTTALILASTAEHWARVAAQFEDDLQAAAGAALGASGVYSDGNGSITVLVPRCIEAAVEAEPWFLERYAVLSARCGGGGSSGSAGDRISEGVALWAGIGIGASFVVLAIEFVRARRRPARAPSEEETVPMVGLPWASREGGAAREEASSSFSDYAVESSCPSHGGSILSAESRSAVPLGFFTNNKSFFGRENEDFYVV
ncbi:hypothetical protein DIPPA_27882 [Diplonema papillatum]|nr:hypothetical protein DIPPA_27882 [Diplonema papillatum]